MTRIDGKTMLAGVIGSPLGHTLSPAMHNAVYEHLGLNWVYLPFDIPDETALRRFMALAPTLRMVGFNVTMPFKQAVLDLCDEVAMAARMAGAVNTVHVVEGKLVGYNTDGRGILEALESEARTTAEGKHIVILGTGGAAGGALVAFLLARAASITVVGRTLDKAEALLERLGSHLDQMRSEALTYAHAETRAREADIIVNATSVGMAPDDPSPIPIQWLSSGQIIYDMVYGTLSPTRLTQEAAQAGATTLNGLGMLVAQGAVAVDIWNHSKQVRTPRDVMRAAVERELERHRMGE